MSYGYLKRVNSITRVIEDTLIRSGKFNFQNNFLIEMKWIGKFLFQLNIIQPPKKTKKWYTVKTHTFKFHYLCTIQQVNTECIGS